MKSILISFLLLLFVSALSKPLQAQGFSIGGALIYGFEVENPGLKADGVYTLNDKFRIGADISFFFPETESDGEFEVKASWNSFNINGHFLFIRQDDLTVYLLAGVNVANLKVSFSGLSISDSFTGLNLGGGVEIPLHPVSLFGEVKAAGLAGDADQLVIGAGARIPL